MSNGNQRPPVWQSEDWWACFLGWFIILLAIIGLKEIEAGKWVVGLLPAGPKIAKWTSFGGRFSQRHGHPLAEPLALCLYGGHHHDRRHLHEIRSKAVHPRFCGDFLSGV